MNKENKWERNITSFLSAQMISLFGSSLVQFAIIWHITLTTSSGKMMTIATLCGFLPQLIVSLFAGVWTDRYNRKKLIVLADGVIAFSTLILAVLFLLGHKYIWLLFITLIIRSVGSGIQMPAVNAILPQIVPKKDLLKINGINATLNALTMFLAPAISAGLLSVTSIETIFFIDVITAIIGISITMAIPIKEHVKENIKNSSIQNFKEGLKYLKENQFIKNLLIFQIIVVFLVSPSAFLTPLLVSRTFGSEYWRLSLSEMTFSFGAILGGLIVAKFSNHEVFKNKFRMTVYSAIFYGLMTIGMGISWMFSLYIIFNTLIGLTMPCYNSPITSILQDKVPENMQGRVFSFMQISTSSALPLGMVIFGPLADIIKIQTILITTGTIILLFTIYENQILSTKDS